jgi:hypothetical protein
MLREFADTPQWLVKLTPTCDRENDRALDMNDLPGISVSFRE